MINESVIRKVLDETITDGGDFGEIFIEDKVSNSIQSVGGKIEKTVSGRDFGVGIRIFSGFNSVYVYTNDASLDNLISITKKAKLAIKKSDGQILDFIKKELETNHNIKIYPFDVKKTQKVDVIKEISTEAKAYHESISQVRVSLNDYTQKVLVANTEGVFRSDERTRIRFGIQSVSEKNGEMQTGYISPGSHKGYEFVDEIDYLWYAKEASRMAVAMIDAGYAPSGQMPVVIDNGFGGVIFHEACGHGLEATSVAKGNSVFAGKIGQMVAKPILTAIDDGTLSNEWGSANMDDEGTDTKKNVLIENGILKGYMVDKLNGRRMGMDSTGSSRRQSYKFAPTSRMTNTFIANGESKKEDLIASIENGLYAKYMGGGSVNPATGEFNFAVREGYLVKNGKIDKPVRGASLIGKGIDALGKIDMIADNLAFDQGMCGSISGSIPANVGQPAVRISSITVGGR